MAGGDGRPGPFPAGAPASAPQLPAPVTVSRFPHGAAAALSRAAQSLPCPPAPAIMPLTRSRRPHYDDAVSA